MQGKFQEENTNRYTHIMHKFLIPSKVQFLKGEAPNADTITEMEHGKVPKRK